MAGRHPESVFTAVERIPLSLVPSPADFFRMVPQLPAQILTASMVLAQMLPECSSIFLSIEFTKGQRRMAPRAWRSGWLPAALRLWPEKVRQSAPR
ncbi:hypothetical protein [Pannonibacter indicus]|uniref:hypothetical protein n=1 Tax=Pannonibacter indicus TaxID=466044 RepID=UPI00391B016D